MTRPAWLFAVVAASALGACGKVGTLDQPAPLYGAKAKAQYQARKDAAAAAAQAKKDDDQVEALPKTGPYDPNADPGTLRAQPAPGMLPSPNGAPPPGVLPDPYNHPQ